MFRSLFPVDGRVEPLRSRRKKEWKDGQHQKKRAVMIQKELSLSSESRSINPCCLKKDLCSIFRFSCLLELRKDLTFLFSSNRFLMNKNCSAYHKRSRIERSQYFLYLFTMCTEKDPKNHVLRTRTQFFPYGLVEASQCHCRE